jgi:hypothetical protein
MKPIYVRWSVLVAAVLCLALPASAQERPPGILNSLELTELVARARPADHIRLSGHFGALADRYVAEASRHRLMSRLGGNAGRNVGVGATVHCRQLADLNTQSATTARELAVYHAMLAVGLAGTPPHGAARFHGGAGAPEPTQHEVNVAIARARTRAEQSVLQEYFLMRVRHFTGNADEHVRLAQTFRGTRIAHAAVHQDWLAERARTSAKEAQATAEITMHLATWTE